MAAGPATLFNRKVVLGTNLPRSDVPLMHPAIPTNAPVLQAGVAGPGAMTFVMPQLLFDVVSPAGAMLLASVLASGVHHVVSKRKQPWAR